MRELSGDGEGREGVSSTIRASLLREADSYERWAVLRKEAGVDAEEGPVSMLAVGEQGRNEDKLDLLTSISSPPSTTPSTLSNDGSEYSSSLHR